MKKSKVILATITMAILAISMAVVSCKKEKQEQTQNNMEQSERSSENMDAYLLSFKEKLLSAEKGGELLSLEEARLNLSDLLNFDFDDANYPSDVYQVDTIHAQLRLTQGQVELSQMAITYKDAVNSIRETYHGINIPEKSVLCILCSFNELETKGEEIEDVEIIVVTRGFIGDSILPNDHDTLSWHPKNEAGTCDGQYINQYGGPDIIRRWIFYGKGTPYCPNGRVYYTNTADWITFGHLHYDPIESEFLIYTSFAPNQDTVCISHDKMEYYYHNIFSIYHQQPFGTHHIILQEVDHRHVTGYVQALQQYLSFYTWKVNFRHGKINCTNDPVDY